MKKLLALLMCAALLVALAACAADTKPEETDPISSDNPTAAPTAAPTGGNPTTPAEEHDHAHVSYKGLESAAFTLADMEAAEERAPDFTVDQADTTLYVYNNVTLDSLTFTQVQYTYAETGNRISCTFTADSELDTVMEQYREAMTALYGEPNADSPDAPVYWIWRDGHTANYVMLTQLNDTTVQLVFYICEGAQ